MKILAAFCLIALLTLHLSATEPAPAAKAPRIYMIGDSTMCVYDHKNNFPQYGWGEMLPEFFKPGVTILDRAKAGKSTLSFRNEKLWDPIAADLKPGDWVVIQFGHNDLNKSKPANYTEADTAYRALLTQYVEEVRAKGAQPILATSICRHVFMPDGTVKPTIGEYPRVTREVAAAQNVPLVDMNESTARLLAGMGDEKSRELFMYLDPGQSTFFPNGIQDHTHLKQAGARAVAGLFAAGLREINSPLVPWLKETATAK